MIQASEQELLDACVAVALWFRRGGVGRQRIDRHELRNYDANALLIQEITSAT
jgi:hypothetical protein